ncbi:hypothetical protein Z946_225 [Sulfitobacter noctilucicola]|nr:hypothetical protein Z946_225 [Sulfitobacter noctilucicola]
MIMILCGTNLGLFIGTAQLSQPRDWKTGLQKSLLPHMLT